MTHVEEDMRSILTIICAGALLCPVAAQAGLVTVTFGTGGTTGFTSGGGGPVLVSGPLTLTLTAGCTPPSTNCSSPALTASSSGYGVNSVSTDPDPGMDGNGSTDLMTFTFSSPVTLTQILLNEWDSGDGGILQNLTTATTLLDTAAFSSATLDLTTNNVGSSFRLTIKDGNDDYWVRSLTFEDGTIPPEEIPEPSTCVLIGAGLAALGLFRRRRRQRA